MTGIRLADLPAAVRARVEAELGQSRPRGKSRAGVGNAAPCPGHCITCASPFRTYAAWERHADRDHGGHAHWRIDLEALT